MLRGGSERAYAASATLLAMQHAIERAVSELTRCPALRGRSLHAVWIFGSHARGEAGPGSDLDLGVLCDPPLGLEVAVLIDQLSRAIGGEVDVIDLATTSATLAWEILTSGKLVLEADERAVEEFLRKTRYAADDEMQRNRMIVLAQAPRIGTAGS